MSTRITIAFALEPIRWPSPSGVVPTPAFRRVISGTSVIAATEPTTATLASTLAVSKAIFLPNTRLAPAPGLMRENVGCSALVERWTPLVWAALATIATSSTIPAIGPSVVSRVLRTSSIRPCNPAAEVTELPLAICAHEARIAPASESAILGPNADTPTSPAPSTAAPLSSTDLAT